MFDGIDVIWVEKMMKIRFDDSVGKMWCWQPSYTSGHGGSVASMAVSASIRTYLFMVH